MNKVLDYLILAFLFLLPWQTRWIYQPAELNGGYWEYGTLSLYGTEILMWLIILIFSINKFTRKDFWNEITDKKLFKERWPRLIFAFALLAYFSFLIWHSLNWEISYQFVLRMLGAFCLSVVVLGVGEKRKMIVALWSGGVVQGLLALWQFFTQHIGANKWLGLAEQSARQTGTSVIEFGDERWLRAYGSFGWPNALGIYLAAILIVGILLYASVENYRNKILVLVGQLVILSGLILSFSRGAWLATFVAIILLFVVVKNKKDVAKHAVYYSLIFILFFIALKPLFLTRANGTERLEQKSMLERQSQVREWQNIFSKKWFFGVGAGNYTLALYELDPNKPVWQYQPVHNMYMLALAELGIFGVLLLLVFLCIILHYIYKKSITYLPVAGVLLIAGLFDHWSWSMFTGLVFVWVLLAVSFFKNSREVVSGELVND